MSTTWVRTYENGIDYSESLDGVIWADAPLPRRWHRCTPQTRGWLGANYTERCACGATRLRASGPWIYKNETRKGRKRQRREERAPKETVTCRKCGSTYEAVAGSLIAQQRLCTQCWAKRFVAGEL